MILLFIVVAGAAAGVSALLAGLICIRALRKHCVAGEAANAELRSELQSMVREHKVECSAQIEKLGGNVAVLELSAQNIDEAGKGGLTRSRRAQAMQLLRSGVSPESASSTLGIGKREMRLIARVARTLSLQ